VRLVYPECSLEMREKIACAQFIFDLLMDGFIKRTLQIPLEGVNFLRAAIKRSVAVKVIQQNSFSRGNKSYSREKFNFARGNNNKGREKGKKIGKKLEKKIFVTFMGMEVRNVGNAGQLGISDRNVCP